MQILPFFFERQCPIPINKNEIIFKGISMNREVKEWLSRMDQDNWLFVTLTMKQRAGFQRLDEIAASTNLRHFLNRLNQKLLQNRYRKHGERLEVVSFQERSSAGRLHYHLGIENPLSSQQRLEAALCP